MNYIELKAPAKINIGLYITSKREDGYHNLYTLFYPVYGLYDTLKFRLSETQSFSSNSPEIAFDENNLIIKALRILENESGKTLNVDISCDKNIPLGAGLGGGSSDAAATLLALNEIYRLRIPLERLKELALLLGSDVPFFIRAKPAIGESRGEKLTEVDLFIDSYLVIVNPGIHISTGEAFKNIKPKATIFDYTRILSDGKLNLANQPTPVNDFEDFVFKTHPEIAIIKHKLYKSGACFSQMSGSGSSVYGLFKDKINEESLRLLFPANYLVKVVPPAPGFH